MWTNRFARFPMPFIDAGSMKRDVTGLACEAWQFFGCWMDHTETDDAVIYLRQLLKVLIPHVDGIDHTAAVIC